MVLSLAAVLTAACGAATDLRDHKIYNRLTIPAMAAGIAANTVLGGFLGLGNGIFGLLLGQAMILTWRLGMLKAGDVKLYMAVGAVGGWRFCAYTIIFSILSGGIGAFFVLLAGRNGRRALLRLFLYIKHLAVTRSFQPYSPEDSEGYFSFGCFILIGAVGALWQIEFGGF